MNFSFILALAAVGDWAIYEKSGTKKEGMGGTSASAPFWAAVIALANEKRANLPIPKKPLGFINEALYKLAASKDIFNDITEGNNKLNEDYPSCEAQKVFDACTGWGTPKGTALMDALVNSIP